MGRQLAIVCERFVDLKRERNHHREERSTTAMASSSLNRRAKGSSTSKEDDTKVEALNDVVTIARCGKCGRLGPAKAACRNQRRTPLTGKEQLSQEHLHEQLQ